MLGVNRTEVLGGMPQVANKRTRKQASHVRREIGPSREMRIGAGVRTDNRVQHVGISQHLHLQQPKVEPEGVGLMGSQLYSFLVGERIADDLWAVRGQRR